MLHYRKEDPVVVNSPKRRNTYLYWELRAARDYVKPHLDDAKFGRGGLPNIENFSEWHPYEQIVYLLWLNGCRVPFASAHDNTVDWMILRAGETNNLFSLILDRAKKLNESLYKQLSELRERIPGEPLPEGIYEDGSGPSDNDKYIYPMQGIFGYSASRVLSEIIGRREKGTALSLFANAIELLDSVIEVSSAPSEFVARLTGRGFENGAGAIPMLSHLLPNGILTEQNSFTDYRDLAHDLSIHAPKVWSAYQDAHPDVLVMNDIAPMSRFISSG